MKLLCCKYLKVGSLFCVGLENLMLVKVVSSYYFLKTSDLESEAYDQKDNLIDFSANYESPFV